MALSCLEKGEGGREGRVSYRLSNKGNAGVNGVLVLARQEEGGTFLPAGRRGRDGGRN